jgi:transposase InsO family protein
MSPVGYSAFRCRVVTRWHNRPPSPRAIRHAFLTDLIRQIHRDSRGTYGARRIHAELTLGHQLAVGHNAVEMLMRRAGIAGIGGRPRFRRIANIATAHDLVERQFARHDPDQLWVTDITEHPTLRGQAVLGRRTRVRFPAESSGGQSTHHRPQR